MVLHFISDWLTLKRATLKSKSLVALTSLELFNENQSAG